MARNLAPQPSTTTQHAKECRQNVPVSMYSTMHELSMSQYDSQHLTPRHLEDTHAPYLPPQLDPMTLPGLDSAKAVMGELGSSSMMKCCPTPPCESRRSMGGVPLIEVPTLGQRLLFPVLLSFLPLSPDADDDGVGVGTAGEGTADEGTADDGAEVPNSSSALLWPEVEVPPARLPVLLGALGAPGRLGALDPPKPSDWPYFAVKLGTRDGNCGTSGSEEGWRRCDSVLCERWEPERERWRLEGKISLSGRAVS